MTTAKSKLRLSIAAALFAMVLPQPLPAQEPATWRVLIEPKFMSREVTQPIPGAHATVLAAACEDEAGLTCLSREQFAALKVTWEQFAETARANAKDRKVAASFVRDKKQVIQYAVLKSDDPLTATVILAPDFFQTFTDIFGPEFLVAIPNRFTVYVFPKLASRYQECGPMVIRDYFATPYPVSLEVFEISATGMRAVGAYEEP